MAPRAKRRVGGGHSARLRLGKRRLITVQIPIEDDREAERAADWLAKLAHRLVRAKLADYAPRVLEHAFAAPRDVVDAMVERMVAGRVKDRDARGGGPTFKSFARRWTDGELHRLFPDRVPKIDHAINELRLAKHVYPVVGDIPIRAVTRENAEEVLRRLPETAARASRRHVAQLVARVLNLAELAGVVERSPIPRGWLPKKGRPKDAPVLYAEEDAALLGCPERDVPLAYRVLYGFLHREGMRIGEALDLEWSELDLDRGVVQLDENKTDHARWWKLGPGVAAALTAWRKACPNRDGRVFELSTSHHHADRVRLHLAKAGIVRGRLHSRGTNTLRFGVHGFRHSFVTRSLALGKSDDWVRQRTGHTTDQLRTYREPARAYAELEPAELLPLDRAIPEFRSDGDAAAGGDPEGDPESSKSEAVEVTQVRECEGEDLNLHGFLAHWNLNPVGSVASLLEQVNSMTSGAGASTARHECTPLAPEGDHEIAATVAEALADGDDPDFAAALARLRHLTGE